MESVLEQQRKLHEERERLEDALVKERLLKKPTVSARFRYLIKAHLDGHLFMYVGQGSDQL